MTSRRVAIIGYGMAGARLADQIRRHDPTGDCVAVTMVGAEQHPGYNRILLSSVVAGALGFEEILLHKRDWAEHNGIDLRLGVSAVGLDTDSREIVLDDGSTVDYDDLVLATGSTPWIPPTEGLCEEDGSLAESVVAFRDLDDCRQILDSAPTGTPVAVLGGGLLGLEAARGLAGRGNPVTVVHPIGHVMERQLDSQGGAVLARVLRGMGIEFRLGRTATKYWPGKGLELDDGSVVEAGLVVVSAGTRPASALATAAGLTVDRGVVIDDELRTSDQHVRAIGDCARHSGTVGGLVQPAWEQASVLAELLTGADPDSRYLGTQVVMRLKTRDVDLATMGEVHVEPDCLDAEVVRIEDPTRGRYAKIVLREDRITGAIVLGAPDAAATITQLHDQGTPAPSDRMALLLGRAMPAGSEIPAVETNPAELPASTLICRCNTVDKGRIVAAWRSGARSVEDLVGATHASTGCGGCRTAVGKLCEWMADQNPHPREEEKLGSNQR